MSHASEITGVAFGTATTKDVMQKTITNGADCAHQNCLRRWISVRPVGTRLVELECPCGKTGGVIETGEDLESDVIP